MRHPFFCVGRRLRRLCVDFHLCCRTLHEAWREAPTEREEE